MEDDMRFLSITGFCVRGDRQVAFQEWVAKSEDRIRRSYPPGVEYGGIYAVVMASHRDVGEWMWVDVLDSYGALDRIAAAMKDPDGDLGRINGEFLEFFAVDRVHDTSSFLVKAVADASVMDLPVA